MSPRFYTRTYTPGLTHMGFSRNVSIFTFNETFPLTDDTLIFSFANLSIANCSTRSNQTCPTGCGRVPSGVLLEFLNATDLSLSCQGLLEKNETKRCLNLTGFRPVVCSCAEDWDAPDPSSPHVSMTFFR